MDMITNYYQEFQTMSNEVWELRDKRVDGWFMMDSFWPTFGLAVLYVFIVKVWGPRFMKDRPAYNIDTFLIYYNASQVILSAYIFIQVRNLSNSYFETGLTIDHVVTCLLCRLEFFLTSTGYFQILCFYSC